MTLAGIIAIIKDVWWILSVPLAAVAAIGMFYLRSQFPTRAQAEADFAKVHKSIELLAERVGEAEEQVTRIEADLRQIPDRREVQALGERISRVETAVATSTEAMRGVEKTVTKIDHTLSLILQHLLGEKT